MKKPKMYQDSILEFLPDGVKPVTEVIVCPTCGGNGSHFPKHLDDSRMVDIMIEDGDQEGLEYYHSGGFNVTCQTCLGRNVVKSVCMEWVNENHPQAVIELNNYLKWEAQYLAYADAESRACGGY